jgi:hypothetical protein
MVFNEPGNAPVHQTTRLGFAVASSVDLASDPAPLIVAADVETTAAEDASARAAHAILCAGQSLAAVGATEACGST